MNGQNPSLTPTEDLILEVLAARHRLGETLWTFDIRHKKALIALDGKGLITLMHGVVEKTLRASLTSKGRDHALDSNYADRRAERTGQVLSAHSDCLRGARFDGDLIRFGCGITLPTDEDSNLHDLNLAHITRALTGEAP